MDKHLMEILDTKNPTALEYYLEKFISNDPDNLARIYSELEAYLHEDNLKKETQVQTIQPKHKKSQSMTVLPLLSQKHHKNNYHKINSTQSSIKQSQLMMINKLTDKGNRPTIESEEQGLFILSKMQGKIMNPLKLNPSVPYLKKSKLIKMCDKYMLNKNYYEGDQYKNKNIKPENLAFDEDMHQFIIRRRKLLQDILQKKLSLNDYYLDKHKRPRQHINLQVHQDVQSMKERQVIQEKQSEGVKRAPNLNIFNQFKIKPKRESYSEVLTYRNSINKIIKTPSIKSRHKKDPKNSNKQILTKIKESEQMNRYVDYHNPESEEQLFPIDESSRYNTQYVGMLKPKHDNSKTNRYSKQLQKDQLKMRKYFKA